MYDICGVADQLHQNYASDLRSILKCIFDMHSDPLPEPVVVKDPANAPATTTADPSTSNYRQNLMVSVRDATRPVDVREAPTWIPDSESAVCCGCTVPFTFVRRKHHCRNCGKIFCQQCSSNTVPLPHFQIAKPVRVCNHCMLFSLSPFSGSDESAPPIPARSAATATSAS